MCAGEDIPTGGTGAVANPATVVVATGVGSAVGATVGALVDSAVSSIFNSKGTEHSGHDSGDNDIISKVAKDNGMLLTSQTDRF